MIIDQFEEMRRTTGDEPLVMSVILHSFISGQPFRLRALRRALDHILQAGEPLWITQPGAIASHFQTVQRLLAPGSLPPCAPASVGGAPSGGFAGFRAAAAHMAIGRSSSLPSAMCRASIRICSTSIIRPAA